MVNFLFLNSIGEVSKSKNKTKPIDTIKEICESEEEDLSPFKVHQNARAKSSSIMKRVYGSSKNNNFLKSSYKQIDLASYYCNRDSQTNKTYLNSDICDIPFNSSMVYASSSIVRPKTTTFSSYNQKLTQQ